MRVGGFSPSPLTKKGSACVIHSLPAMSDVHCWACYVLGRGVQVKLVWYYNNAMGRPNKKKFIARNKAYHGSTIASASLTGLAPLHSRYHEGAAFASQAGRKEPATDVPALPFLPM